MQRLVIGNVLESVEFSSAPTPKIASPEDEEASEAPPSRQLVILPTGAGKSLCFQIPALLLEGPTLVIYPLLALIEDQRRRLAERGIEVVVLRGGQDRELRQSGLRALASGRAKIAIATPEVLAGRELLSSLAKMGIAHLAIDEAHCVSEWGESFRPAYLEIGNLAEILKPLAISAFTATASESVLEAMALSLFKGHSWRLVAGDPDRPNISYSVMPTLSRAHSLMSLLDRLARPLIIFASSRRGVERVAGLIRERRGEREVRFYHAGLEVAEKRAIENWFLPSQEGILVATCAYGLGVDKKNVRTVVHWELPGSIEAYLQESGRAGRDGEAAQAFLLVGPEEESRAQRTGTPREVARRKALLGYARSHEGCRREALLSLLGAQSGGACSGCDRCAGQAIHEAEGEAEILDFLRRNPRRFDLAEALARIGGESGRDPPLLAAVGLLESWHRADASMAFKALLVSRKIAAAGSFFWKERLYVPREARRALA